MNRHTPGPWMADPYYPSVLAPTAPNLALCNDHLIPMSERLANARLIAAAPLLYEALKLARSIIGHPDDAHTQMIEAAIKAVEGENT